MSESIQPTVSSLWFISDMHLSRDTPIVSSAVEHFLSDLTLKAERQPSSVQALYLLGDLFEVWIGDDALPEDETAQMLTKGCHQLAQRGVKIFLQHGNRDFLFGQAFADACSAKLLPENHTTRLYGQNTLIQHGDQLCSDDVEYQQLRHLIRSKTWQQDFLAKDKATRFQIANQYRQASVKAQSNKTLEIMDVNEQTTQQMMSEYQAQLLIHGHTHRPGLHRYRSPSDKLLRCRAVLGDWHQHGFALEVNPQGIGLKRWPIEASLNQAILVDHLQWSAIETFDDSHNREQTHNSETP